MELSVAVRVEPGPVNVGASGTLLVHVTVLGKDPNRRRESVCN